jgi:hypothetical protein
VDERRPLLSPRERRGSRRKKAEVKKTARFFLPEVKAEKKTVRFFLPEEKASCFFLRYLLFPPLPAFPSATCFFLWGTSQRKNCTFFLWGLFPSTYRFFFRSPKYTNILFLVGFFFV